MGDRVKITPEGARRIIGATEGYERIYKGGGSAQRRGAFLNGEIACFKATGTISAGTALATPGSGPATIYQGQTPTTRAAGLTSLTIYNDGTATIASGTLVYCVFMNGGWFVFWVLCP